MSRFKVAERTLTKLRLALFGPSGSGKTLSSLKLAAGIGRYEARRRGEKGYGNILVIDAENGRSGAYVGSKKLPPNWRWQYELIKPPFDPKKFIEPLKVAEKEKFDVVVIDGLSQAWAGKGGMLDIKDKEVLKKSSGSRNDFAAWRLVSKYHADLVDALLQTDLHIIVSCRSKTEYKMVTDPLTQKTKVEKMGLAPVFRDGLEYEFLVCFDLNMKHEANPTKDNTSIFDAGESVVEEMIDSTYGQRLCEWLYESEEDDSTSQEPKQDDEEKQASQNHAKEQKRKII